VQSCEHLPIKCIQWGTLLTNACSQGKSCCCVCLAVFCFIACSLLDKTLWLPPPCLNLPQVSCIQLSIVQPSSFVKRILDSIEVVQASATNNQTPVSGYFYKSLVPFESDNSSVPLSIRMGSLWNILHWSQQQT
jgi:hypothetical protein